MTSTTEELPTRADAVVIGAGHNGLVTAILLARAGLDVVVLERAGTVGGATRTEAPFPRVPGLRHSTGSYLLGLMPPELVRTLGVDLPLLRRDPHYFLPTPGGPGSPHLLLGSDAGATRRQLEQFFSPADVQADAALQAELAMLREDLAPAWLRPPLSLEDTAERHVRPGLRRAFVDLCSGSVADYLARFTFSSELLVTMYVVTDGLSGLTAGPDTPGSGHNFLVHNMCRLPGSGGTWMIVRGGMGTVSGRFADAARAAGAVISTSTPVEAVLSDGGAVAGVRLENGRQVSAAVVVGACDPFTLGELAGDAAPAAFTERLDRVRRPGTTLKLNLALRGLPEFSCLPAGSPSPWGSDTTSPWGSDTASPWGSDTASPWGSTIHLLPSGDRPLDAVRRMWSDVQAGRLPEVPTIEWYLHTTVDPSLQDDAGHHSSALFVQSVPYDIAGSTWEVELPGYVEHLLGICERFAPGTRDLVADSFALPPPGIAAHFGIRHGHIHHVDNTVSFTDRVPYATGLPGLYAGSAGTHPAGSVIGAAGHNVAQAVLSDLGLAAVGPG